MRKINPPKKINDILVMTSLPLERKPILKIFLKKKAKCLNAKVNSIDLLARLIEYAYNRGTPEKSKHGLLYRENIM